MYCELLLRKIYKMFNKSTFLNKLFINRVGDIILQISPIMFLNFLSLLKNLRLFQLKSIVDILTIDELKTSTNRFLLVYNFLSVRNRFRIYARCIPLIEKQKIVDNLIIYQAFSIEKLYAGAGWLERENWDLFGIFFFSNQDLRRILTDYGFEGYPMRKDFPLSGYVELSYNDEQKVVIYDKVEMTQEFRFFEVESVW